MGVGLQLPGSPPGQDDVDPVFPILTQQPLILAVFLGTASGLRQNSMCAITFCLASQVPPRINTGLGSSPIS